MVKLASVRSARTYGPPEQQDTFEYLNAVAYVVATILFLAGVILLLPGFNHFVAFITLIIALVLILLVNVHDLYAQLAGIDFKLHLLAYDPQLALVEVAAPLVQTIGGSLFLIAVVLILKAKKGEGFPDTGDDGEEAALRLFIAGSVFWLLGSIHNAFQVYERTSLRVQVYQKSVYLPFVIASSLFLVSSVLWIESWPHDAESKGQYAAATMAVVACVLLVIGSIANVIRIIHLRTIITQGGVLEKLRGGAQERLDFERGHGKPFLEHEYGRRQQATGTEESFTYRDAVIQ